MNDGFEATAGALLARLEDGDSSAADELLPLVYDELRVRARRAMARERGNHTLQTTALVHEAWMRVRGEARSAADPDRFLAVAARAMRRVLVDHARSRRAAKRGGGASAVPLDEALASFERDGADMLALDEALSELAQKDERLTRIVELRYFAGLSLAEVAAQLEASTTRVHELWEFARAWLRRRLA